MLPLHCVAILGLFTVLPIITADDLPTLYEYYAGGDIKAGLSADQTYFTLNEKNITILSGTIHYFRVPSQYWRDRLRKLRAAGLNTVETYLAWNLHEWKNGVFDFGEGGSDFEEFLNFENFIKIAQEEDLFVIVRAGPYICAEWEWGGLPSWLLYDDTINLKVRTSDPNYIHYVTRYFYKILPKLHDLQFVRGGPIIMIQIENEYGYAPERDLDYLKQLYDMYKAAGIVELLVTSDGARSKTSGSLPGYVLQTVNFGSNPIENFDSLKTFQPDKPIMVMEYWTGWFDHWSENHHRVDSETFRKNYEEILTYPASANMYMFHGGTNFGFLNGASIGSGDNSAYQPTTTSYDYDAPLAENGDYTEKYEIVAELIAKYNPIKTKTPERPKLIPRVAYPSIPVSEYLNFENILEATDVVSGKKPLPMERLPLGNNTGQSYGYIVYRIQDIDIPANAVLRIGGHIRDSIIVLVNNQLVSPRLKSSEDLNNFGFSKKANSSLTLTTTNLTNAVVDLVLENWGRGNGGKMYKQFKGLFEENVVSIDGVTIEMWEMYPLEFKKSWTVALKNWNPLNFAEQTSPTLYRAILKLEEDPVDTYIDMQEWTKGIVIVNGFVLGRYAKIGPQQTLYLPAPFLKKGDNEILVFEHFQASSEIKFSADPIFKTL